jgi:hypothetical protein
MAKRHRFITVRDCSWWTFNVAVFGMKPDATSKQTQKEELKEVVPPSVLATHH